MDKREDARGWLAATEPALKQALDDVEWPRRDGEGEERILPESIWAAIAARVARAG